MEQGESVAGYICRYLGANGHCINHKYFDLLKSLYLSKPYTSLRALTKIQQLVGDISQLDSKFWLKRPAVYSRCLDGWVPLNIYDVRFCPQCLREKGFHFALWEFSLVYACPIHETALLESCTACGNKFHWAKIAPAWLCPCGEPINAMQPAPAKSGRVALARLLAYAEDVVLLESMEFKLPPIHHHTYKVIDLYKMLEWGSELARKLSPTKNYARRYPFDRYNRIIVPLPTVAWVAKLIFSPSIALDKTVTRAIKRHFNVEDSLLESFCVDDEIVVAIEFIVQNPKEFLARKLNDSLDLCLKKYRYPLPLGFDVFFNPRLTDEEFKDCLNNFSEWWIRFSKPMVTLNSKDHDVLYRSLDSSNYKINVDLLIFQILKVFLKASWQKIDVRSFYALTDWWRIPDELRKPKPPEETLYQIGVYLKSISHTELIIAHSLLMNGQDKFA
jgi:hypothetical protein